MNPSFNPTVRVKRFVVPAEAVREELRDAVQNERTVRAVVIAVWSVAALLVGVLVAIAR